MYHVSMNIVLLLLLFLSLLCLLNRVTIGESLENVPEECNPTLCGGIVYKCIFSGHCRCDNIRTNQTCHHDCAVCLGYDYDNCCLCLDLCDPIGEVIVSNPLHRSNLEFVGEPQPDLFESLTELPDPMGRWKAVTEQVRLNLTTDSSPEYQPTSVPCTVAYLPDCMPFHKCKVSCSSMGSTALRWFHDGCCQCIGTFCPQHGFERSEVHDCQLCNFDFNTEDDTNLPFDE